MVPIARPAIYADRAMETMELDLALGSIVARRA
jgi:hypothetical protein